MQSGKSCIELAELLQEVKAIALDWNGTALDDIDRALTATNQVLGDHGISELSTSEFRDTFCLPMSSYFKSLGIADQSIERAEGLWNVVLARGPIKLGIGIVELLKSAGDAGIPVGIISAASEEVVRADAERLGIASSLEFVSGGPRPKSETLRDLANQFGGRIVYSGDTEYDILEAKKADAIAVGFAGGYRRRDDLLQALPDYVIDDFNELAHLLSKLRIAPI